VEILRDVALFLHLVGFGALFGGEFVQLRDADKVVNSAMLHGVLTSVLSGLLLVGVIEGLDEPVDHVKIAVKFGVALVIAVLCWVNRARDRVPNGLFYFIVLLTVANVAIAVFW
jgi:hypothetical protein